VEEWLTIMLVDVGNRVGSFVVVAALPPHMAESLWLSGTPLLWNFGEAEPRRKRRRAGPVRRSLTAMCGGKAASFNPQIFRNQPRP